MANLIDLVIWATVPLKENYDALAVKDTKTLYFIENTGELFKGDKPFNEPTILVDTLPTVPAKGKIYILNSDLSGQVWTGTEWKLVIKPIATVLNDTDIQSNAVSGETIKAYITDKLAAEVKSKYIDTISYDPASNSLKYLVNAVEHDVPLSDFITNASYDSATGVITFTTKVGDPITINIPKDNFVKAGTYDNANKQIVLTLQDDTTVTIPAADLVNLNSFQNTQTVENTVDGSGVVSINVKVSAEAQNSLQIKDDGLYVQQGVTTVETGKTDELLTANEDGSFKASGTKIGGVTIAETPNGNTVATEAAVAAIRTALADAITAIDGTDKYVPLNKVTTEINFSAPADDKVVSESAVVDALSWITISDVITLLNVATANTVEVDGKTYVKYQLTTSEPADVNLVKADINSITINGVAYIIPEDNFLWFDQASDTGLYNVEVLLKTGVLYQTVINYVKP